VARWSGGLKHYGRSGDPEVALLTLSFSGDLPLCRLLCASIDRFADPSMHHVIAVPGSERALFAVMAGPRRTVIALEDLQPPWLFRLPMPGPAWRTRLGLPRRDVYLSLKSLPVRGWIAQQIMKIALAKAVQADIVVHVDSDLAFVRYFSLKDIMIDGEARLHREVGEGDGPPYSSWNRAVSRLLGIELSEYHGADFIDSAVVWRRENVVHLTERIERVCAMPWQLALARTRSFSEYLLYGVFCDKLLGFGRAGHAPTSESLCRTIWSPPENGSFPEPEIGLAQVAIAVQSTIPMSLEARAEYVARATLLAAGHDAERAGGSATRNEAGGSARSA
jgi:hypothetical protein